MKKRMKVLAYCLLACAAAHAAGPTATLLKNRASYNADVETAMKQGKWLSNFYKAKKYATDNNLPFIAVWSNGDSCGHCVMFEKSVNSAYFRDWMKKSGMVFYFTYYGDKGDGTTTKSGKKADDGTVASKIFHWCRKNTQTAYPFVRVYWPAGKVDIATVGDTVDKVKENTTGGKNCVNYFKSKLKKFKPLPTVEVPYTVAFDSNGGTGEMADVAAMSNVSLTLPANAFTYPDYAFAGWAKTADGAVAYKDKAAVGCLSTVTNDVVTLYAKWTRTTYRDYTAGVKATIEMPDCKGWSVSSGAVTGMKWSSSTGKWTGTPTVAKTFTVKYKKSSSTKTRTVVVDPGLPYSIAFAPNGGTNEMETVDLQYGVARALPANAFVRPDYSFAGWAKTASGSVAYKNKVSVKNLTTVSNKVVTLYAKWTRVTYRTYYTGVKATITMSDCKGWTKKSGAISGMSWKSSTGKWTGTPTKAGTYTIKYKRGSSTKTRSVVVVKDSLMLANELAEQYVVGNPLEALDLSPSTLAGVPKAISVTGLPAGLGYDAATGCITGTPTRVGTFTVKVTVTSAKSQKFTRSFKVAVYVPDACIGTFNGFIGVNPDSSDPLALDNRGTFTLTARSDADLSAKVVTAKGTYTLTGRGWIVNEDGSYTAELATSDGEDTLLFTVPGDSTSTDFVSYGVFTPSYGTEYEVWAQRSPFGKDASGAYADPLVSANADKFVGEWRFAVAAQPLTSNLWTVAFADADPAFRVSVSEDGKAVLAGTIGDFTVTGASSTVFVFEDDVNAGFVRADFAIPVTVGDAKKTLDVRLRLWFDRDNGRLESLNGEIGKIVLGEFE